MRLVDDAGRTQWNHATTSVGYASSSDSRVHLGLGIAPPCVKSKCVGPAGYGRRCIQRALTESWW